ncbi:MAG: phage tail tape measure protein [Desulfovibrio sp.]|nr:phage tail tape measure protein [Desulfovibrio sp.]
MIKSAIVHPPRLFRAPVATAAGASIELVSAMAGVMGDAGIQGTMAGTAMRSMFTRMVAPAKDAKRHMAQMDITAEQMAEIMADPETQAAARHIKQMGIQVADEQGNLRDWMDSRNCPSKWRTSPSRNACRRRRPSSASPPWQAAWLCWRP